MPIAVDTQIRSTIDQFVAEISQLVRQAAVEAVTGALGQGGVSAPTKRKTATPAPTRRKAGRKPGRPKGSGKRVRRSSADLEAQGAEILAYVRANPGTRMEGLSAAVRTPTKELRRPILELIATGQLRTEGQKRGTQYFGGRRNATTKKKAKATRKKATRRKAKRAKRKTTKKAA